MTKTRDLADLGGGFIQAGTGAVQRTVESKLQDVVSVKDFGAVGDGVTDDTAAIQAAIDYVSNERVAPNSGPPANVSKQLVIPAGTYLVSSTLKIDGDNICVVGAGPGVSIFKRTGDYGNTFEVRVPRDPSFPPYGDVTGWPLYGVTLRDFAVVCYTMPSTGAHIRADACKYMNIENINFSGAYRCVHLRGCTRTYLKRLQYIDDGAPVDLHTGYTPPAGSAFILVDRNGVGLDNWSSFNSEVYIDDCNIEVVDGTLSFECGASLQNGDGLWVTQSYFKNTTKAGIYINPMDAYTRLNGIKIHNTWIDNGGSAGVLVENTPGSDTTVYVLGDLDIRGCSLLGAQVGVLLNASGIRSTIIADCRVGLSVAQGILVNAYGYELKIDNCSIVGNNTGNYSYGGGIDIVGGVSDFSITNNKVGGNLDNGSIQGLERYGIRIQSGASDNYIVTGNDCRRVQLLAIQDSGTGTNKVVTNNLTTLVP